MAIQLTDDGTLDTVLVCTVCAEEFRFAGMPDLELGERCEHGIRGDEGCEKCREAWIDDCIAEVTAEHDPCED